MNPIIRSSMILVIVLLTVLAVPVLDYVLGYNFRTVEEGAFYRARQMNTSALERTIRRYNIKTVVNLRGENEEASWFVDERDVCKQAGIALVSYSWTKKRIPDPESLADFVSLIENGEKPFLVHCQGGTHRTGVAAACYELLRGKSPEEARKQFCFWFGNAPIGRVVDLYEGSDLPFAQWVVEEYPSLYSQEMEPDNILEDNSQAEPLTVSQNTSHMINEMCILYSY